MNSSAKPAYEVEAEAYEKAARIVDGFKIGPDDKAYTFEQIEDRDDAIARKIRAMKPQATTPDQKQE